MPTRLKLNIFSPLPPLRTSIADHTARLLAAVAEIADVAAWTFQEAWDEIPGIPVHRFDDRTDPTPFHAADMNFYNLGNNSPFHRPIYDLARRVPGIVILHDPNLGYFFADVGGSPEGRRRYLKFAARQYGADGLSASCAMFGGKLRLEDIMMRYPMTEAALENALGALSHNRQISQELAQSTGLPSFHVPLSHSTDRIEPRLRADHPPPYRLITFGYLGANRRLDVIARTLSGYLQRGLFRWDVYGTVQVRSRAFNAAMRRFPGLVEAHDYVEESTLDQALADADLAINLRNPTMGEASSSQLRIWEHALPSLVTRVGWYADQPADTVFFVDPEREAESLGQHLAAFLRNPALFHAVGRRGRAHLDRVHDIRQYARALAEIAAQSRPLHARRAALDLAHRSTDALLSVVDPHWIPLLSPIIAQRIGELLAV